MLLEGELKSIGGQSVGEDRAGLQLVEKLATPLMTRPPVHTKPVNPLTSKLSSRAGGLKSRANESRMKQKLKHYPLFWYILNNDISSLSKRKTSNIYSKKGRQ